MALEKLSLTLTLERLSWIFAVGVGTAAGGTLLLLLTTAARLAREIIYLRKATVHSVVGKYLPTAKERAALYTAKWPWKAALPLLGGGFLALKAAGDGALVISCYLLAAGGILAWRVASRERKPRYTEQVEELVVKLSSIWLTRPQPFVALEEAASDIGEPLRRWVREAADSYRLGVPAERIWRRLREGTDDACLRQLVDILAWAEEAGTREVAESLNGLEGRLRARRDVRRRARVSLAMISGTSRFLQAADGAAVVLSVLVPYLWNFYLESPSRQLVFCVVATWFLGGALYMQSALERVRERAL